MTKPAPLILTLAMDERSFAFFDEQRRRYFPPERNFIPAHLTLFHRLPGDQTEAVRLKLEQRSAEQSCFPLDVTGLRSLGRGVAYTLHAPELAALRESLAQHWLQWLTPQDRQKHQPHVTIQNNVDAEKARRLLVELQAGFNPRQVRAQGLDLWRYLGGPWELIRHYPFAADQ